MIGAIITGRVPLKRNQILHVAIGQTGNHGLSGSGGTFVCLQKDDQSIEKLIIAGGAGGDFEGAGGYAPGDESDDDDVGDTSDEDVANDDNSGDDNVTRESIATRYRCCNAQLEEHGNGSGDFYEQTGCENEAIG